MNWQSPLICKAQHGHCKGYNSDSHYSHPWKSRCTILLLFISLCASRARPSYSYSLSSTRKLQVSLLLNLCHAWVWIIEWQQCENKVAARTQKWRRHGQRWVSLYVLQPLLGTKLLHWGGQIFIQPHGNALTLVDKKAEGKRWALQGKSSYALLLIRYYCTSCLFLQCLIILHFCCLARLTTWQLQKLIEAEVREVIFTLQCPAVADLGRGWGVVAPCSGGFSAK